MKIITTFWGILFFFSKVYGAEISDFALPSSPSIKSGQASFEQTHDKLTIQQSSNKLITNWSSFNIGKDAAVEFIQPNSSSNALNRVNSSDPTYIYGSLKANGNLLLINPSGVLFKEGSRVDVGSIIASSLNLKDGDFLNDQYIFEKDGFAGTVSNEGAINAFEGGAVALIGPQALNEGQISVDGGSVAMLAGEKVTLTLNGNKLIQYTIDRGTVDSLVSNKEAIEAGEGVIILSAKGLESVSQAVVNNAGTVKADSITKKGGKIFLTARNGSVNNAGSVSANSKNDIGGDIEITADEIVVSKEAKISATGELGGGQILVGGSWQNSDPGVYQATNTEVAEGSVIDASALTKGDGGEVVVWSKVDDKSAVTHANGSIFARGGISGGNGGKIETSGASLEINGIVVDAGERDGIGAAGHWLIDPYNYTIGSSQASSIVGTLNLNTNVTVTTQNNVTSHGSFGSSSDDGDITINANINSSGSGDLTLRADRNIILNNYQISTGGDIIISAVGNFDNDRGSDALVTSGGRWVVYTADDNTPANFGSLNSGNNAIWGKTINSLSPASVPAGNRYVFAESNDQQITFTTTDISKIYGETIDLTSNYTIATNGLSGIANVYSAVNSGAVNIGDVYSVNPTFATTGGPEADGTLVDADQGTYTITASSGTIKDGFNVTHANNGVLTINPKALSATVSAANKVYDGTTTATGTLSLSGLIGSESLNTSVASSFDTKDVGTGKTVTVDTVTLSDGTNGGLASNYSLAAGQTTTANVTAKALSATVSAANKVYDGATTATGTLSLSGLIGSESLNTSVASSFDTKDVGTGKTVTVDTVTLSDGTNGGLASNYSLAAGQTTTANVTAKALSATVSAANKVYDGATTATGTLSLSGLIGSESLNTSVASSFDTKDVGTGKTVTVDTVTLSDGTNGGLASNYSLAAGQTTTANVTAKALSATVSAANKVYDGATTATGTLSLSGLIGSESLNTSVASSFDTKDVGTGKTVTVDTVTLSDGTNGGLASNYSLAAGQTTTANVTAKALSATVSAANKVYDGATTATGTLSLSGLIGSESLNTSVASSFDTKDVGTGKTVTVDTVTLSDGTNGGLASNYSLAAGQTTTANVTAKALSATVSAANKVYDGATTATGTLSLSGLIGSESLNTSVASSFDTKDVGTGKTVTVDTVTLSDGTNGGLASNYSLAAGQTTTANVTAKALSATVSAANKVYDGATTATGTLSLSGLIGSESLNTSVASSFDTKDVGTGKTVTVDTVTLSDGTNDGLASNYSLAAGQTTTANVTAKALSATVSAANKVYDGATTATGTLSLSGLIGSESLNTSVASSFDTKDVGTGKTVTVDTVTLSDGTNGGLASNYSLAAGQTTTANVTEKALTISGLTSADRVYDGTITASVSGTAVLQSAISAGSGADNDGKPYDNDSVSLTGTASATFNSKDVTSANTVDFTGLSLTGTGSSNYTLTDHATASHSITAKALSATVSAANKVYDGATTATGTLSLSGLIGSESLNTSVASSFDTKDVGTGKTVTVDTVTLSDGTNGGLASNYSLAAGQTTTANVTAKALSATVSAANKVYDGATTATGTLSLSGLIGSESLNTSVASSFDTKDVGTGKTVTVDTVTLSDGTNGGLASNYSLAAGQTTTANVTEKALTISGLTSADRVYDGTITASVSGTAVLQSAISAGSGADNDGKPYDNDSVSLTGTASATFNSKDVTSANTVSFTGLSLTGTGSSNYTLTDHATASHSITAKALTISGLTSADRVYDGTTTASVSGTAVLQSAISAGSGVDNDGKSYNVDIVSLTGASAATATFNSKDVLTASTVTFAGVGITGAGVSNYTLTPHPTALHSITPVPLTISVNASSKPYDGAETAYAVVLFDTSELINDETLGQVVGATFPDKNVGTGKTVTINLINLLDGENGGIGSNYSVPVGQTDTADITPRVLTATASADDKVYDGVNTAVTTLTFSDLVGTETLGQSVVSTFDTKNVGTSKTVTVDSITLSDGSNGGLAANYTINPGQTTTANITAKPVTVTGITAPNKVYNGLTGATVNVSGIDETGIGIIAGDTGTVSISATGVFSDKNVGSGKTVTLTSSASGADASNYAFTHQTSTTADITAKPVTVTGITASNKVYDGLTSVVVYSSGASGWLGGDDITISSTGVFSDKNVGAGKTVTLTSSASGADVSNYAFTHQTSTTADITAKPVTVSGITASNKVYDGLTGASVNVSGIDETGIGILAGDTGTVSISATGVFSDKNVGSGKTVTLTSSTSGADASNYAFTHQTSTTADITAKPVTVSGITASNKEYDGLTGASVNVSGIDETGIGIVAGDTGTVSISATGVFSDKNVGSGKTVTLTSSTSGADASNYAFTHQTSTTADITAKPVTVSGIIASNKVYDGLTGASVNVSGIDETGIGILAGDTGTVSISATGVFSDKNVGAGKTVTLTSSASGADVSNYAFTHQTSTTADITAKPVTVSGITASNKVYDGLTGASVNVSGIDETGIGILAGDTGTVSISATGVFSDKNVGSGKTVTLTSSTSGADASNYAFTHQTSTTADITAKPVTVSGITASNKVYDGLTGASVNVSGIDETGIGILAGDTGTVSISATGVFSDKNVGSGKTVTLTSSTSGADASNYAFTHQTSTTADITAKPVTVSGIIASNKEYDGLTGASVNVSGIDETGIGILAGDTGTVSISATGVFSDKNVGAGKTVTLTSSASGADVSNYAFTHQTSTTADITAKPVTVTGITASNKVYDGLTGASVNVSGIDETGIGILAGDTGTVSISATGVFSDKNVGSGKTVTLTSSASGADVSNYAITHQMSTTANIMAKPVTVSGITASNKVYDGLTGASVNVSGIDETGIGILAGDTGTVSISATGVFSDKNVGSGKTVTLTSSASGADVGNYAFTHQMSTTANIMAKPVTVTGITASNKEYDGLTSVVVDSSGASGWVIGDDISISSTGIFSDKNVGAGKTVTLTSSTSGADLGNYTLTHQASTTADITAKPVTVTGITASNKVYDGLTEATVDVSGIDETGIGILAGDTGTVTISATGDFSDKNVEAGKAVALISTTSGVDSSNYNFTHQATTTADITAKPVTVTGITALNKVYDGLTAATVDVSGIDETGIGILAGDTGTVTISAMGDFSDKNVGAGKTVTLTSSASGADVNNYAFTHQTSTTANITAKPVTVTGITASNKEYDGLTSVVVDSSGASGWVIGDDISISSTGIFSDKNVEVAKTVTLTSSASGADLGNYTLTHQASTTADITAKPVTVTGITASNKVYDGLTEATVDVSGIDETGIGILAGDTGTVTISATGDFSDKNVGAGKTVTLTSSTSGVDASNYAFTHQSSASANITKKPVTVTGITAADREFNNNEIAYLDLTNIDKDGIGFIQGDEIEIFSTGLFEDKNVGINKTVTITSSYFGKDVENYEISDQLSTSADIRKAYVLLDVLEDQIKTTDDENFFVSGIASVLGLPLVYSSSETNVASINPSNGEVSIVGEGISELTVTLEETENYYSISENLTLTVHNNQKASSSAVRNASASISESNSGSSEVKTEIQNEMPKSQTFVNFTGIESNINSEDQGAGSPELPNTSNSNTGDTSNQLENFFDNPSAPSVEEGSSETGVENSQEVDVPETTETDGVGTTEVVEEKPGGIGGFLKGIFGGGKKEESSESTPAPSVEEGSGETGVENSQEVDVPEATETDGGSATEVVEEKQGGVGGFLKGIFGGGKKVESSESTPAPSEETGSGETGVENSQEVDVPGAMETDGGSATEVVEEKPGGIGGFLKGIFGGGKKEESSESIPAPSGETGSGETGVENSQKMDVPETPETDEGSATEVVEEKPRGIGGFLKGIFGGGKKVESSESTPAPSGETGSEETSFKNSEDTESQDEESEEEKQLDDQESSDEVNE